MIETIFALSSGAPPAAIAVMRISGPLAGDALSRLAGTLPEPRRAAYSRLYNATGDVLDQALVLWFPGPGTATGEDLAELHLHGGRAVIGAVEQVLAAMPKLRRATPGEFTRRAFTNGRIDLAEAEGLADLLSAETELQRKSAIAMAGGEFSRTVEAWRAELLRVSAALEAALDFSDEDDVASLPSGLAAALQDLHHAIDSWLERPRATQLREGYKVVLAGPPNSGKSTLFNRIVEYEAAITAPVAGTTRDVLSQPLAIAGVPFVFFDTAGLRSDAVDEIEAIGVEKARSALENADLVLWLGSEGNGPIGAWEIEAQSDRDGHVTKGAPCHRLSGLTGEGVDALRMDLVETALAAMPRPGEAALNDRQHQLLQEAGRWIQSASVQTDVLLVAEELRLARVAFDTLLGRTTTEDMLDVLFSRFCIGK